MKAKNSSGRRRDLRRGQSENLVFTDCSAGTSVNYRTTGAECLRAEMRCKEI